MGGSAGDQGGGRMSAMPTKSDTPELTPKGRQNPRANHLTETSWRWLRFLDECDHVVASYALGLASWSNFFEIDCFAALEDNGRCYLGELCGSGVFYISDGLVIPDIIRIDEAHRRRGLATSICDIAAEHAGVPWGEPTLLTDGMQFWPAYRGQPSTNVACAGS
jgi:hypothetical protein